MTPVARINPQRVMIRMHPAPTILECLSSIGGNVKLNAHHVNVVRITRVHSNLTVIKRPRIEAIHSLPALAAVLTAENAPTLKTILPLLFLRIGSLPTKVGGVWLTRAATAPAKRQLQLLLLLAQRLQPWAGEVFQREPAPDARPVLGPLDVVSIIDK